MSTMQTSSYQPPYLVGRNPLHHTHSRIPGRGRQVQRTGSEKAGDPRGYFGRLWRMFTRPLAKVGKSCQK
jgi:hypothetical protein